MNKVYLRYLLVLIQVFFLCYSSLSYSDERIYETRLFFGRDVALDKEDCEINYVTNMLWNKFVQDVVADEFDAFTVLDASGYWLGEEEYSKIIIFTYKVDENAEKNLQKTSDIALSYARMFCQDAVMQIYLKDNGQLYRDFITPD